MMEFADKDIQSQSPYKIIKMINGDDVLCKILQEYADAVVVECPMAITRHQVMDSPEHVIEHTGLQRWINFTNDIKFVIDKEKILGFGNLAPEVIVYYKMISGKAKEEAGIESDNTEEEDKIMEKIRVNVDRLEQIMEPSEHTEEVDKRITHLQPKKILH
jgi:mannosyltransferase OCH1-like enzyme